MPFCDRTFDNFQNFPFPQMGREKENELLAELYIQHKNFMYNIANAVLRDPGEAENAVHDAFVRVIGNIEKFDLRDCHKTKNLLGTIVKGVRCRRVPAQEKYSNAAEEVTLTADVLMDLRACLSRKAAFVLIAADPH
jgi:DNA-directed RNA polymerase specialized sigma24 family protein